MNGSGSSRARALLAPIIRRWQLETDGEVRTTRSSVLLPVLRAGRPAMLKLAQHDEERRGGELLELWNGVGAARVLARDGHALLMERATGPASLASLTRSGRDDEAVRILCAVTARLHLHRDVSCSWRPTPLHSWFRSLLDAGRGDRGLLGAAARVAAQLLETQSDRVVLHGDLHHDNVLDFGDRGWLAIDPKGLVGDRAFDYANPFRNPDLEAALAPGRFERRLEVVAAAANLDRHRLTQWILAFAGLSAAWILADGGEPAADLAVAGRAHAVLQGA